MTGEGHKTKLNVNFGPHEFIRQYDAKEKRSIHEFNMEVEKLLECRLNKRVAVKNIDYTPKLLPVQNSENILEIIQNVDRWCHIDCENTKNNSTCHSKEGNVSCSKLKCNIMNVTIEDIISQVIVTLPSDSDVALWDVDTTVSSSNENKFSMYIKVRLKETEDIILFEKPSTTVTQGTNHAEHIEELNKRYEYITVGKGCIRRCITSEAQTVSILCKTRQVNTERTGKVNAETYVSNYDMFDTYAELENIQSKSVLNSNFYESLDLNNIATQNRQVGKIGIKFNFHLAAMLIQRLLASNVYREQQKRFRNMYLPDPLSTEIKYLYQLKTLWTYKTREGLGRSVASMSWCHVNGDLIAIAYGTYSLTSHIGRINGYVCIWSIKNPVNPEQTYKYNVPVTAVSFSKTIPQLLAVGLFNGNVEIRDISQKSNGPVAKSHRGEFLCIEPIYDIEWVVSTFNEGLEWGQLLAISQDGSIIKYCLTGGPFLDQFLQMKLNRIEGSVEGLKVRREENFIEADRHPQVLTLKIHPKKTDIYYVGTDEGCIVKCSRNYSHQHLDVLQVHDGGVFAIEFSPWSEKIFLTCGSDWYIRIWVEGIFEPIIELCSGIGPVHTACWSPVNSTIIISLTGNAVEIWDLRRSILKPASSKVFSKANNLTIARFSNCGRSLAVGDAEGEVYMCALENMPFPPRFQYEELQSSIMNSLTSNPRLAQQVASLGFLGYEEQHRNNVLKKYLSK